MIKLILLLLFPILLFGEVSTNNQAQSLLSIFNAAQANWIAIIIPIALRLFWLLVTIDWVWTFGMLLLKGTDFSEIVTTLIQKIIIIGFFLAMFQFTGWLDTIPQTFSQMADNANALATPIEPDTILEQGFNIVHTIWGGTSWFSSPGDSIALVLAGLIILFAFIIMTAQFFVVIVKIYLLTVGAYIVLALGGLGYTRTMGINPIIAIFKAGLELFFIKLLLGFSLNTINTMAANVGTDNNSIMAMIGVSILIAALVSMVSGLVDSLTNAYLGTNGSLAGNTKSTMQGVGMGAMGGAMAGMAQIQNNNNQSSGSSENSTQNDSGNFLNSASQKAKSASALTMGGIAGAMSGAVKGAMGFSTYSAGQKSGRTIGKLFSSNENTTSDEKRNTSSEPFISGSIQEGKSVDTENNSDNNNNDDSDYISGVPRDDKDE